MSALLENNLDVSYIDVESEYGHDSFLLEVPLYHDVLRAYFDRISLELS